MSTIGAECWLHRVHLPPKAPRPQELKGAIAPRSEAFLTESAERKHHLEHLLHCAASGQTVTTKSGSILRYSDLQKMPEGMQLVLSKSGIMWEADGRASLLIPLLLADVMFAPVKSPKLTFPFSRVPEATHVILIAPRVPGTSAVWLLCTNAGDSDVSVDHLVMSFSRRGAVRWDVRHCYHFSAKCCGQGGHGTIFGGVSLLPLYDAHRKLIQSKGDVLNMGKVHNFGRVAVKIWDKLDSAMVRREVEFLQQAAGHPNISAMLGVYAEAQRKKSSVVWLLVMEHCTGGDLFDVIKENHLPRGRILDIQVGLLSALVHLHVMGIVHRDIKAENVVIQKDHAVLIDFGIAAYLDDEEAMRKPVGSPGYAAPEIIAFSPTRYDELVDIFALGVLSYFMIFRSLPFWAGTHEEMLDKTRRCEVEIPEFEVDGYRPIISLLLRMLSRDAPHRPSAMHCFQEVRDMAPEVTKSTKESRAFKIAYAALVRFGYVEPPGDDSLDEFSEANEGSGDVSASVSRAPSGAMLSPMPTSPASPAITNTSMKSRTSMLNRVGSMLSSTRRHISTLRLPRVGPTISKVFRNVAHLSESSMSTAARPSQMDRTDKAGSTQDRARLTPEQDEHSGHSLHEAVQVLSGVEAGSGSKAAQELPGRVASNYSDLAEAARGESKEQSKSPAGALQPSGSTTIGGSKSGIQTESDVAYALGGRQRNGTIESAQPSRSGTVASRNPKSETLGSTGSKMPRVNSLDADSSQGGCSSRITVRLGDYRFAVDEEPDELDEEDAGSNEGSLQDDEPSAAHPRKDGLPNDADELPAERWREDLIPQIVHVAAAAPSIQPPLEPMPPAGERPKGLPKHRQRGLGMFKKRLSQKDSSQQAEQGEPDAFEFAPVIGDELE